MGRGGADKSESFEFGDVVRSGLDVADQPKPVVLADWSEAILDEALRGKLSRGISNRDEREALYDVFNEMVRLYASFGGRAAKPESEAAAGAAYGIAAAVAILMSHPIENLEAIDSEYFSRDQLVVKAQKLIDETRDTLERKRSNGIARNILKQHFENMSGRADPRLRAYRDGLAAAAAILSGLDSGDPKQIIVQATS